MAHEAGHFDNPTWASGSPITDGLSVYAYFESFGLYAFDMTGTLLWEKDLGGKRMRNQFGEGSTPGTPRQHARRRLGSPERPVVRQRARQARRQGTVARAAHGRW